MINDQLQQLLNQYGVSPATTQGITSNPYLSQLSNTGSLNNLQPNANAANSLIGSGSASSLVNPAASASNLVGPSGALNALSSNSASNLNALQSPSSLNQIKNLGDIQSLKTNVPYSNPYVQITPTDNPALVPQQVQAIGPYDFNAVGKPTNVGGVQTYGVNKLTGQDVVNLVNNSSSATANNANSILNQLKSTGLTNQQLADLAGMDVSKLNTNMASLDKLGSQTYGGSTAAQIINTINNSSKITNAYAYINLRDTMNKWGLSAQQLADLTGMTPANAKAWMDSVNKSANSAIAALTHYN